MRVIKHSEKELEQLGAANKQSEKKAQKKPANKQSETPANKGAVNE